MDRLKKKYDTARTLVPEPIIEKTTGATIGVIAFGSTVAAVNEARVFLAEDKGLKSDFMRLARPCPVRNRPRISSKGMNASTSSKPTGMGNSYRS